MSYILDALKKSEKKRMQGRVPDVLSSQEVVYREPNRRRLWPYLIVAVLVVNVLAAVWLMPREPRQSNAITESRVTTDIAPKEYDPAPAGVNKPESADGARIVKSSADSPKSAAETQPLSDRHVIRENRLISASAKNAGDTTSAEVSKSASDEDAAHDTPAGAQAESPATNGPGEPKHELDVLPVPNKVYSLSELPLSIQQKLPSFSISVFLYSDDPSSRMVKINNKMLREGDYLAEGLKLEEINQNSLTLSYQNFRFRIGLK